MTLEVISESVLDETSDGVNINYIKYADNTVLIADSDVDLHNLIDRVESPCLEFGMEINIKKKKKMSNRKSSYIPTRQNKWINTGVC